MSHLAPTAKWDARYIGPIPHDATYYAKCMLGGALACGITHAALTPLDVAKCNMQVNPTKYKGAISGLATIIREEGQAGIWKGFGPTLVGYSLQGMFKFGLYEVFKDQYMNLAGEELTNKYKPAIWLVGSASAEVFADIALCPLEMTKVKIQTSPTGTFPTAFGAALAEMSRTKIPYTMAKFCCYEKIPKETYSKTTQLGITFASGYLAGVVCAVVSHPADTVVSLMGKPTNKGKSIGTIASETGLVTLATKGLGTRVLMIGTLTGFQWWIYDTFKASMGLGTTGGK
ncbi:mitochondrial carrier protein [Suillus subalutaceus]|uniref:mitochondrial carrier protein n=1 Tax=Suillus subalutaceus TaxID=48586 RepID=UPI001B8824BC|nr:mitochondrial carrier protein [Suillus subalutaceus]KAG1854830.1 mitochondrial carrier protein [Suillus subalutaceus]